MKIEVGMYVRTKYGLIRKLDKITKDIYSFQDRLCFKEDIDNFIKEAKFSYDITDLIEVGDVLVVDGIKYTVLQNKEHCNNILHIKTIDNHYSTIKYLFEQNKVESILTKEQFEREVYKI